MSLIMSSRALWHRGSTRLALSKARMDHIYIFNGDTFIDVDIDITEGMGQLIKSLLLWPEKLTVSR